MIKNIIFDLGGVILNIDHRLMVAAFKNLATPDFEQHFSNAKQTSLFDEFETGKISSSHFRKELIKQLKIETLSDEDFDQAWNTMLLDMPKARVDFVKMLRETRGLRTFLYSNTNEIHLKRVFEICQRDIGSYGFANCFEKEYYSHLLQQRKPNQAGFLHILRENILIPEETLFVDDTLEHIKGANEVGIKTFHLVEDKSLFVVDDCLF